MSDIARLHTRPRLTPDGADISLPGWVYGNQEFHELEHRYIFQTSWNVLCHLSDIPNVGDYQAMDIHGERVFGIRAEDQNIRVFYNVCRHRGHALVAGSKGSARPVIRCPYHSWTYCLDGRLRAISAREGSTKIKLSQLPKDKFNLRELESEIYLGFIWFRFVAGGPSVRDRFAPVADELELLKFDRIEPHRDHYEYDLGCDWKTVMDNFNECYHCPAGHPSLTALFDARAGGEDAYETRLTRQWGDVAKKPSKYWSGRLYQRLLPDNEVLPVNYRRRWLYYVLYPLVWIDVQPDQIDYVQLLPQGPGKTRARGCVYTHGDYSREMEAARFLADRINASTQREDDEFTASVQRGLLSQSYTAGLLSEDEHLVASLHEWIRQDIPVARMIDRPAAGAVHSVNAEMVCHV